MPVSLTFDFTQTTVLAYTNDRSPIRKTRHKIFSDPFDCNILFHVFPRIPDLLITDIHIKFKKNTEKTKKNRMKKIVDVRFFVTLPSVNLD